MDSVETVDDARSVFDLVKAVNASDRASNLEPKAKSDDAARTYSKLEVDLT